MIFLEPGVVTFSDDLLEQSKNGIELYALMGDVCAQAN